MFHKLKQNTHTKERSGISNMEFLKLRRFIAEIFFPNISIINVKKGRTFCEESDYNLLRTVFVLSMYVITLISLI